MRNRKRSFWWVIATEKDGSMGYLKKECRYYSEAVIIMKNLEKTSPDFRYEIVEIH